MDNPSDHQDSMDTLSQVMERNRQDGYTAEFMLEADGLHLKDSDRVYQPQELRMVAHHRFEGVSDPADMTAIYLIESTDGVKGLIVDAFGTYSDRSLSDFLKEVPSTEDR
jgi:hypothetical protein